MNDCRWGRLSLYRYSLLSYINFIAALYLFNPICLGAPQANGGIGAGVAIPSLPPANARSLPIDPWQPARLSDGRVAVYVELSDPPAVEVYLAKHGAIKGTLPSPAALKSNAPAIAAAKTSIAALTQHQSDFATKLKVAGISSEVLFKTQRVANAVALYVSPYAVPSIAEIPGVKRVLPLPASQLIATSPANFTRATAFRNTTGLTGAGIDVAVIDSGIDYFHRDFGGPGTGANDPAIIGDTPGIFPGPKIAGGYDFGGENYTGDNLPNPDPDPVDCYGHGTAVAGVLAGFGITTLGTTYAGPWDFSSGAAPAFAIEPGIAPQARIFDYKINGCTNNTRLVAQALELAIDPNEDGDFSDAPDVINLSVTRRIGSLAQNPEIEATRRAAELGIVIVAGAGNDGDTNFILGTPAISPYVIAAAADFTDDAVLDRVTITSPTALTFAAGISTLDGPRPPLGGVSGPLQLVATKPDCSGLTTTASLAGTIAVFNTLDCGLSTQTLRAQQAGAIGVIAIQGPYSPAQIADENHAPAVTIPRCLISRTDGEVLLNLLAAGTVLGKIDGDSPTTHSEFAETVAGFSSRGPGRGELQTKPDVAAPGANITGPRVGSGSGGLTSSGTSFATPIIAGEAALLRQLHPDWQWQELKALIINTASHDQKVMPGDSFAAPPARAGAGRIDLENARQAKAIAFNPIHPESVGVSFGALEVVDTLTTQCTVRVLNKGATTINYDVGFETLSPIPGVQTSFPNGFALSVPPGESRDIPLQLAIPDASALRMARPRGLAATQFGRERYYEPEWNGNMRFTPDDGSPVLKVPMIASIRQASRMHSSVDLAQIGPNGEQFAALHGTGFSSAAPYPEGVGALAWPMELLYNAPALPPVPAGLEQCAIRAVGVRALNTNNGALDGLSIYFGIAAHADWETPNEVFYWVYFDFDGDGSEDARLVNSGFLGQLDVLSAFLEKPLGTPAFGTYYLNDWLPSGLPTYVFNTNVMVQHVDATQLGLDLQHTRFRFRVASQSLDTAQFVDSTPWMTYDPLHPGMNFGQNVNYFDREGSVVGWDLNSNNIAANHTQGLLMLHGMNVAGERAETILFKSAADSWMLYR